MRVPAKYLFYDGLPNAKDIDKIMADNGYISPYNTQPDKRNLQSPDVARYQPLPGYYQDINPSAASRNLPQVDNSGYNPIDDVSASVGQPGSPMGLIANQPKTPPVNNPNNFADYFNTALGVADSLIPGEKIHNNYPTQPLPTYNPYQYGTGSQALMYDGGALGLSGNIYGKTNEPDPYAASGIHIKPENRGKFTAYKKRTGKTTEEALHSKDPHVRKMANFARNAKKWHHGEDGLEIPHYNPNIQYDQGGQMPQLPVYDPNVQYASGGDISAAKAAEILHDGTANGKKLTPKQRRFMGWKSHQAAAGTVVDPDPTKKKNVLNNSAIGENQMGNMQSSMTRRPTNMLDNVNYTLTHGGARTPGLGTLSPEETQLMTDAYIWSQRPDMKGQAPQQIISSYFGRPVGNTPTDKLRASLNQVNYGAASDYNQTPNMSVRDPNNITPAQVSPATATMASGGFVEGSIHDLSEEQIAGMLKKGYRFEHFKD